MRFSPTLGARQFLRQVLSQLQVRRRSTGTAVTGGENQLVVDELGFAAVPFGATRTRAGVNVCSTRLHKATIPHLGDLEVSPPDQTLCRMAPLRHIAPRNDSVVALHFNGPAVAKQRMLRVWDCWQRRLEGSCASITGARQPPSQQRDWQQRSRTGYCARTLPGEGDCDCGEKGMFSVSSELAANGEHALTRWCLEQCARCTRCSVVSVSAKWADCSWFRECDIARLRNDVDGFVSVALN